MISITTLILFFVYFWGLGNTALSVLKIKKQESFWERQLVYLAIGFGIFPFLSILLNFLHLPLDWKIFLALSVIYPLFSFIKFSYRTHLSKPSSSSSDVSSSSSDLKKYFKQPFQLRKSDLYLFLSIAIALFSLWMYATGAFSYPYLEDEDPWGHAVGVKYVAVEKTAYDPALEGVGEIDPVLSYIDPYPPAYDILLGILHQTSPDIQWTMKFFNALIISLGFIFFFLLAKKLFGSPQKALFSTFILASVPAYLSHFIWAHSLAVTLFFPVMYAFLHIKEEKKWMWIAVLLVASAWVSQNMEQPLKITSMVLIFLFVASLSSRKFLKYEALALVLGIMLSFLWWGAMIEKYSFAGFTQYYAGGTVNEGETIELGKASETGERGFNLLHFIGSIWSTFTSPWGSESRPYSVDDFFVAQNTNMINNPVGLGKVVTLLVLLGVVYLIGYLLIKYKTALAQPEGWVAVLTLFWLIYAFWGVNGAAFPISVARGAFRMWVWLAIAVALVAPAGGDALFNLCKRFFASSSRKYIFAVLLLSLFVGVIFTSGMQKYRVNTAIWPTSGSFSQGPQEAFAFAQWFSSIPPNEKIFMYAPRDKLVIGMGGFSCQWCQEVFNFRKDILEKDVEMLYSFLKDENYRYFLIYPSLDLKYSKKAYGEEMARELINQRYDEIFASAHFTPIFTQENLLVIFAVNP